MTALGNDPLNPVLLDNGDVRYGSYGSYGRVLYTGSLPLGSYVKFGENTFRTRQGDYGPELYNPSGGLVQAHTPRDYVEPGYNGDPKPPPGTLGGSPTGVNDIYNPTNAKLIGQNGIKNGPATTSQFATALRDQQGNVFQRGSGAAEVQGQFIGVRSVGGAEQDARVQASRDRANALRFQTAVNESQPSGLIFVNGRAGLIEKERLTVPELFKQLGAPGPPKLIGQISFGREGGVENRLSDIPLLGGFLPDRSLFFTKVPGLNDVSRTSKIYEQTITAPNDVSARLAGLPGKGTYTLTSEERQDFPRLSRTEQASKSESAFLQMAAAEPLINEKGQFELLNGKGLSVAFAKTVVGGSKLLESAGQSLSSFGESFAGKLPVPLGLPGDVGTGLAITGGAVQSLGADILGRPQSILNDVAAGAALETGIGGVKLARSVRFGVLGEETGPAIGSSTIRLLGDERPALGTLSLRVVSEESAPLARVTLKVAQEEQPVLARVALNVVKDERPALGTLSLPRVTLGQVAEGALLTGFVGGTALEFSNATSNEAKGAVLGRAGTGLVAFGVGQTAGEGVIGLGRSGLETLSTAQSEARLNRKFAGQLITQDTYETLKTVKLEGVDKYLAKRDTQQRYEGQVGKLQGQRSALLSEQARLRDAVKQGEFKYQLLGDTGEGVQVFQKGPFTVRKLGQGDAQVRINAIGEQELPRIDTKIDQLGRANAQAQAKIEEQFTQRITEPHPVGTALVPTKRELTLNVATRELLGDVTVSSAFERNGLAFLSTREERKLGPIEVKTPEELAQPGDLFRVVELERRRSATLRQPQSGPGLEEGSIIGKRQKFSGREVGTISLAKIQERQFSPHSVEMTLPTDLPFNLRRGTIVEQVRLYQPIELSGERSLVPQPEYEPKSDFLRLTRGRSQGLKEAAQPRGPPELLRLSGPQRLESIEALKKFELSDLQFYTLSPETGEFRLAQRTVGKERSVVTAAKLPEAVNTHRNLPPELIKDFLRNTKPGRALLQEEQAKSISALKGEGVEVVVKRPRVIEKIQLKQEGAKKAAPEVGKEVGSGGQVLVTLTKAARQSVQKVGTKQKVQQKARTQTLKGSLSTSAPLPEGKAQASAESSPARQRQTFERVESQAGKLADAVRQKKEQVSLREGGRFAGLSALSARSTVFSTKQESQRVQAQSNAQRVGQAFRFGRLQRQGQSQGKSTLESNSLQKTEGLSLSSSTDVQNVLSDTFKKEKEKLPIVGGFGPSSKKKGGGFQVAIKRRGKFSVVNQEPLSEGDAVQLLKRELKGSAARSGKLLSTDQNGANIYSDLEQLGGEFSLSKRSSDTFVQKGKFSIGTQGEKQEITFAGIRASRGKRRLL